MNVYDLLKKDHDKVSELFDQLEETDGADARARIFNQLKAELEVHSDAEETVLYPRLQDEEETRSLVREAVQEHELVDDLLGDLEDLAKDSPDWMAKAMVLRENVEHHVDEEENELFPKARRILSETEAEELARRIEQEKSRLPKAG